MRFNWGVADAIGDIGGFCRLYTKRAETGRGVSGVCRRPGLPMMRLAGARWTPAASGGNGTGGRAGALARSITPAWRMRAERRLRITPTARIPLPAPSEPPAPGQNRLARLRAALLRAVAPARHAAAAFLVVFAALLAVSTAAQAQITLVKNTNNSALNLTTGNIVAQSFQTGPNADGYIFSEVTIQLGSVSSSGVVVRLRENSAINRPSSLVADLTLMGSLEGGKPNTFTAPDDTTLDASTTYWITVNEDTGQSDRVNLKQTGSTLETGGQRGWKIGDNHLWKTLGTAWGSANNLILLIHIRGFSGICGRTPAVRDALVALIPDVTDCIDVTDAHLAAITGVLDLNRHGIADLAAWDFAGLTKLDQLYLNGNQLPDLPDGVFDELTGLQRLYLRSNQLTELNAGVFDKLTRLTTLELAGNELPDLPDGVFDELTGLQNLYLDSNQLTELNAGVFDKLTGLQNLYLDSNQLTELNAGVFDKLTGLEVLQLADNELPELNAGVFDKLTGLQSLYLDFNQLTELPAGVFEELTLLEYVYLWANPGPDGNKATADFAPVAVALPDDERVPTGDTVRLDGSGSDGGPWGTNVTYRWELTAPASGVMEMFDDDTSVTPRVTIPKLAVDTDLTFTLTVTGRGGASGTAPGTDTATVTMNTTGICARTPGGARQAGGGDLRCHLLHRCHRRPSRRHQRRDVFR